MSPQARGWKRVDDRFWARDGFRIQKGHRGWSWTWWYVVQIERGSPRGRTRTLKAACDAVDAAIIDGGSDKLWGKSYSTPRYLPADPLTHEQRTEAP